MGSTANVQSPFGLAGQSLSSYRTFPSTTVQSPLLVMSRRTAPPPPGTTETTKSPSEQNDEYVFPPPSSQLSRNTSSRKIAPENDPEVRRDFEARIAAATAALNRTPSKSLPRLERKNTKRGAAMVISSPTLVSSSAKLHGAPLSPPGNSIDPAIARALEKSSGSGNKRSLRWKLGFRKGPSISGNDSISSKPTPSPFDHHLEEPIALKSGEFESSAKTQGATNASQPDLNSFRFPHTFGARSTDDLRKFDTRPARPVAEHSGSGLRGLMGMRRGRSDEKPQESTPPIVHVPSSSVPPKPLHTPTSSNDSAIAKFIDAGRAVGLNDIQMSEMLIQKGMLNRSQTSASSKSFPSIAPTSALSQPPPGPITRDASLKRQPSMDKKAGQGGAKGLLRSLSRGKKSGVKKDQVIGTAAPSSTSAKETEVRAARKMVVRRTLLVPSENGSINSVSPNATLPSPLSNLDSPDSSLHRPGASERKASVKRKPLNLSREDQALVSSSPNSHRRKVSIGTTSSDRSNTNVENAGLGFLHPPNLVGERTTSMTGTEAPSDSTSLRRSSGGGSLYDLYSEGGTDGVQETLVSPAQPDHNSKRLTQAVEIWCVTTFLFTV